MADSQVIRQPASTSDVEEQARVAALLARLEVLERTYATTSAALNSIFDRIARGDPVDLVYPDGTIIPITKARPRKSGEGGES